MRQACFIAIAAAAASLAAPARADDSSAALGAGGVVFTQSADIRMADEDLRISPKAVSIRFVFVNDSARDIDTTLAFPLPDIDTSEYTESPLGTTTDDPVNFVGFTVKADGAPVAVSVEQRAIYQGRDVTDVVRAAGLPVNPVNDQGFKALQSLSAAQKRALEAAGLADAESPDDEHPHWTVRIRYYWRQHFPAGRPVVLEQAYQPVTGQSLFGASELSGKSDDAAYYARTYCLDEGARARLSRMIAAAGKADPQGGGYLAAYATDYVLKTGANWKGPIGHFRLTLDKLQADNVLSLCWDGALTKTGPTTFQAELRDFAPVRDIRLLVLEAPAARAP